MKFSLGEGFDKEMKIEIAKILNERELGEWNTSFCQSCGCDLEGYSSYCQTCKREIKIKQII